MQEESATNIIVIRRMGFAKFCLNLLKKSTIGFIEAIVGMIVSQTAGSQMII